MRKFYIENEIGSRLPLNGEEGIFLSNPAGLGMTMPSDFADIHNGFFREISKDSEPQSTVTGDLVFIGDNAYADYRSFVDWCSGSESGYVLKYPYSYTSDLIYSSSSAGSMAADIPAGGHIPAAFELTYKGAIINPKITLVGSSTNTAYGICALNATLSDGESFTVSSFYGKCRVEITGADGVTTDALNNVDLAYEPFPRIPVNEDCVLLMSADSDITGRATVRVYYYYRSV